MFMPYRDFQCSFSGCSGSLAVDACRETLDPNTIDRYAIGETEFEYWDRLWKANPSDPEVDGEEWVNFVERIQDHLRIHHENFPDEFYFWDDFSGDRTLDMKIATPAVLTRRLLSDLQEYLQVHGQKMWRIRIPIYFNSNDPHRVIVIYPDAIDIPPLCPAAVVETHVKNLPKSQLGGADHVTLRFDV
jgi:hypothetical protein